MKSYPKTYSFLVIIAMIMNGCNPELVPLKGKYENSPFEITSTKPGDSLWVNITQLFETKGLVLKHIDKKKGLLTTTKTSFIPVYTFEDPDGQLIKPEAWVVIKKTIVNKKEWNPKSIYSRWNIQITESGNGTTTIKVDPIVICTYYPNMFTSAEGQEQSTGKLEELIRSSILTSSKK
jgi:hypothetical protein